MSKQKRTEYAIFWHPMGGIWKYCLRKKEGNKITLCTGNEVYTREINQDGGIDLSPEDVVENI